MKVAGINCLTIETQISISTHPPKICLCFSFGRSWCLIYSFQVLKIRLIEKKIHVKRNILLSQMRLHIAFHIVTEGINVARKTSMWILWRRWVYNILKQTSHRSNKYHSLQSQCRYLYPFIGIPTKAIKNSMYEQNNCVSFM